MNKYQRPDISILIADDHLMVHAGCGARQPGLRVNGDATTGQPAKLAPVIVLVDICKPDMDGTAASRAIKEAQRNTRVIMAE